MSPDESVASDWIPEDALIARRLIKDGLHIVDRWVHILAIRTAHEHHEVVVAAGRHLRAPHEPIRTTATSS